MKDQGLPANRRYFGAGNATARSHVTRESRLAHRSWSSASKPRTSVVFKRRSGNRFAQENGLSERCPSRTARSPLPTESTACVLMEETRCLLPAHWAQLRCAR
eukprot:scaffold33663_cov32-Tisochrysis_lutea.AAC.3